MKKPNKNREAFRQKKAEQKAARKRQRKQIRQESLNRRANVIEAKKQELFEKWVAAVGKMGYKIDGEEGKGTEG